MGWDEHQIVVPASVFACAPWIWKFLHASFLVWYHADMLNPWVLWCYCSSKEIDPETNWRNVFDSGKSLGPVSGRTYDLRGEVQPENGDRGTDLGFLTRKKLVFPQTSPKAIGFLHLLSSVDASINSMNMMIPVLSWLEKSFFCQLGDKFRNRPRKCCHFQVTRIDFQVKMVDANVAFSLQFAEFIRLFRRQTQKKSKKRLPRGIFQRAPKNSRNLVAKILQDVWQFFLPRFAARWWLHFLFSFHPDENWGKIIQFD